jgi:hypothetical protein
MIPSAQGVRVRLLSRFVFFIAAGMLFSMISLRGKSPISMPCSAPEYHEFDFWLGDWDSFDIADSTKNARVRIDRILDGCVLHEDYQSVDGHKGESFSIYDALRQVWHQSWSPIAASSSSLKATCRTVQWCSEARTALQPENNAMSAESGSPLKAASANLRSPHSTAAKPGRRGSI